jgi:hypothetical protein
MLCASAIYRLAEEEESRDLVRMHGGLEPLVELVQDHDNQADKVSYIIAAIIHMLNWTTEFIAENSQNVYFQNIKVDSRFSFVNSQMRTKL